MQVLDIRDLSVSLMEEVEAIERVERGETRQGRQINRAVPAEAAPDGAASTASAGVGEATGNGPHRLLLQDAKGMKVQAIELKRVDGVKIGMSMGAKLVLRDVLVGRGMVLLETSSVSVLGGKIEVLDRAWREGRKKRLLEELKRGGQGGRGG